MSNEYNHPHLETRPFWKRRNRFQTALVKFIGKRTPECREVVRILSQSSEAKLPLGMRIKLRFHYLICAWCQRYEKQLHELRKFARMLPERVDDCCPETLSYSSKERIKQALREMDQE